jgi:hypothetical protein
VTFEIFCKAAIGQKFSVAGFHAREDGTALIFTKTSDTLATDDAGRVWNFSNSQGLVIEDR